MPGLPVSFCFRALAHNVGIRNQLGHHAVCNQEVQAVLEVVPEARVGRICFLAIRFPVPLLAPDAVQPIVFFPVRP